MLQDAAELLELAWKLTPDDEKTAAGRRFALARTLVRAGDHGEAIAHLDDLLGEATTGALSPGARAAGTHPREAGTALEAEACCKEALEHVGDDAALRARVLVTFARVTQDAERLGRRSRAAIAFLESLDDSDPGLLSEALVGLAGAKYYGGNGIPADVVERALALERISPTPTWATA